VLSLSGRFLPDIISSCPSDISLALLFSISSIAFISTAPVFSTDFNSTAFISTGSISCLLLLLILVISYLKMFIKSIDYCNISTRLLLLSGLSFNYIK